MRRCFAAAVSELLLPYFFSHDVGNVDSIGITPCNRSKATRCVGHSAFAVVHGPTSAGQGAPSANERPALPRHSVVTCGVSVTAATIRPSWQAL